MPMHLVVLGLRLDFKCDHALKSHFTCAILFITQLSANLSPLVFTQAHNDREITSVWTLMMITYYVSLLSQHIPQHPSHPGFNYHHLSCQSARLITLCSSPQTPFSSIHYIVYPTQSNRALIILLLRIWSGSSLI